MTEGTIISAAQQITLAVQKFEANKLHLALVVVTNIYWVLGS